MAAALILFAGLLLVVGLLLWRRSAPPAVGQLVYTDTDREAVSAPINSHKSKLTCKPDFLYRFKGQAVPVEIKKRHAGRFGPRVSDVMQLMAQCVILEDNGDTVTHGVVEYPDKRIPILYGPEKRRKVLETAEAIRAQRRAGTADRSHNEAWRCPCMREASELRSATCLTCLGWSSSLWHARSPGLLTCCNASSQAKQSQMRHTV